VQLHLDRERMNSAYALWPHALTGSASEANGFTREYGVGYRL
jgi:hypothetical protein